MAAKVRTRKRGKTFSYIFEAGIVDGKRKVVEKGGFPTEADAYEAGIEAFTSFKHGNIAIISDKITVESYLRQWLEIVKSNVSPHSYSLYVSDCKIRIIPFFQNMLMRDLTPAIADKWVRSIAAKGYALKTLTRAKAVLHQAMKYAIYPAGLIQSNPVDFIKIPRNVPKNVIKRSLIDDAKMAELRAAFPDGYMNLVIEMLYGTGMRIGEILGLVWENVDLDRGIITVCQQLSEGKRIIPPKTESSKRNVIISKYLADILAKWRDQQFKDKIAADDSYIISYHDDETNILRSCSLRFAAAGIKPLNFVCTQRSGHYVYYQLVQKKLVNYGVNPHSFRHTHATILIETGASPKGVAGRLGHKDVNLTQNLYTHNTEKLQEETLAFFESKMQTNSEKQAKKMQTSD